jgi:hypothetical protein
LNIENRKVLVLGGYGMVGAAVCRELLARAPREIQIHSLRLEEAERARQELLPAAPRTLLSVSAGDIFGLAPPAAGDPGGSGKDGPRNAGDPASAARRERIRAELERLDDADLPSFLLYRLLAESRPEVVVDCVNTATGIAYGDIFTSAEQVLARLEEGAPDAAAIERLLDALYMPRLIRHVQLLYRGMSDAGTRVYVKVGTTGSGGMGLNVPYTHSEEKPSRLLLSKSALAGAQSMLLFLMGRTPGAPITKEIKPAAVIAWKRIGYGPIHRRGQSLPLVAARPRPVPSTFSTDDPAAARDQGRPYENVFIDTGENGVFGLEELIAVSSEEQAELVTPEEIARYLVFEIEGGNTGRDIVAALDGAVLGPTYRGGLVRERAVARMQALEREHGVHSVAFEMLGPPRNVKLLFEAHLLRLAFASFAAARAASPEAMRDALDALVRREPEVADRVVSVGVPILLDSGELLRGPHVLVPAAAREEPVTAEKLAAWAREGWADLRLANCRRWSERLRAIHAELAAIPPDETSSRIVRDRDYWHEEGPLQPGKLLAWILSQEEHGFRFKR